MDVLQQYVDAIARRRIVTHLPLAPPPEWDSGFGSLWPRVAQEVYHVPVAVLQSHPSDVSDMTDRAFLGVVADAARRRDVRMLHACITAGVQPQSSFHVLRGLVSACVGAGSECVRKFLSHALAACEACQWACVAVCGAAVEAAVAGECLEDRRRLERAAMAVLNSEHHEGAAAIVLCRVAREAVCPEEVLAMFRAVQHCSAADAAVGDAAWTYIGRWGHLVPWTAFCKYACQTLMLGGVRAPWLCRAVRAVAEVALRMKDPGALAAHAAFASCAVPALLVTTCSETAGVVLEVINTAMDESEATAALYVALGVAAAMGMWVCGRQLENDSRTAALVWCIVQHEAVCKALVAVPGFVRETTRRVQDVWPACDDAPDLYAALFTLFAHHVPPEHYGSSLVFRARLCCHPAYKGMAMLYYAAQAMVHMGTLGMSTLVAECVGKLAFDAEEDAPDCVVCLESAVTDAARLPCTHVFHKACITAWLVEHGLCPTCRARTLLQMPGRLLE